MSPDRDAPQSSERPLSTWKEIAEHLGVNVRTPQKWEQWRGLPVRRLPGGRGRVLASVRELEAWMKSAGPEERAASPAHRGLLWAGSVVVLILLGIGGAMALFQHRGTPTQFRVDGNALVVSDEHGQELGRKKFGVELIDYSQEFDPQIRRYGAIEDLDGDHEPEVLFIFNVKRGQVKRSGLLYCYSSSGREKWRFEPGRAATKFPEKLQPPYLPFNLLVFRSAGQTRIAVASIHHTWHPSEVAVLSEDGEILREYWHAGHIRRLAAMEDVLPGRPLLLAAGVANGYRSAALVALDPETLGGVSEELSPDFQLPGARGSEWARILFPRSEMNKARKLYNTVADVRVHGTKLEVGVDEEPDESALVLHTFDSRFRYRGAGLSSVFAGRHEELRRLGVVRSRLRSEETEKELSEIRWLKAPPEVDLRAMAGRGLTKD